MSKKAKSNTGRKVTDRKQTTRANAGAITAFSGFLCVSWTFSFGKILPLFWKHNLFCPSMSKVSAYPFFPGSPGRRAPRARASSKAHLQSAVNLCRQ